MSKAPRKAASEDRPACTFGGHPPAARLRRGDDQMDCPARALRRCASCSAVRLRRAAGEGRAGEAADDGAAGRSLGLRGVKSTRTICAQSRIRATAKGRKLLLEGRARACTHTARRRQPCRAGPPWQAVYDPAAPGEAAHQENQLEFLPEFGQDCWGHDPTRQTARPCRIRPNSASWSRTSSARVD